MKDSKFIELLNLYVDHQISDEEAALLEAEIRRDSERRRVYRQYCQMQKACVMLADSFRTEAPAVGDVAAFAPPHRRLHAVAYTMGALAAAACVALVMVSRDRAAPTARAVAATPARATTVATRSAPEPLPTRLSLQPVFTAAVRDNAASTVATSDRGEFEWMRRVQLQRVPNVQELWFESRPTIQPQDLSFPTRASVTEEPSVGVAVRFQR